MIRSHLIVEDFEKLHSKSTTFNLLPEITLNDKDPSSTTQKSVHKQQRKTHYCKINSSVA